MILGVNVTLDPNRAGADCALAAKLGAKVVRTSQEQGWGSVAQRLAPFRKACDDNGLLLMQCCQTRGHVQPRTQADLDAYGAFVAECAAMADRCSTGNEVNGFGSNETPDPKRAATTTLACIAARDRYAAGRLLLTPSMCPASGPIGASYVEPLLFLHTMFDAEPSIVNTGHLWVDWHAYCDGRYNPNTAQVWNQCWRTRAVAQLLASKGSPHRRITWSEFGTATGPSSWAQRVSPAMQAQRLSEQLSEAHAQEAAGVHLGDLVWYRLRCSAPGDWTSQMGLVDVSGASMPVAGVFTAAANA